MAQSVKVRLNRGERRSVKIGKGIREGCCVSQILFNLHNEFLTKEALEVLGDFKIGEENIHAVQYAGEPVLLAKEEKVLQYVTDNLIETGRYYGMWKNKSNENFKITIPSKN